MKLIKKTDLVKTTRINYEEDLNCNTCITMNVLIYALNFYLTWGNIGVKLLSRKGKKNETINEYNLERRRKTVIKIKF